LSKVTVERRQRLRDLCKRIVDDPHSIDGDTKARLRTAAIKHASTLHDDPTQALANLYHDEELGPLLRKAVEIVGEAENGDGGGGASDHHANSRGRLIPPPRRCAPSSSPQTDRSGVACPYA
jgi:hypothetical protein